jgi:hypothetical protein
MKTKTPRGIVLIGLLQIFLAITVLFTLNVQQNPPFNIRFAVPFIPELWVKIFVVVLAIILAYGYLRQTKWGYWSMLIYSVLFCCISLFQATKYGIQPWQPFIVNVSSAVIVAIYTVLHSKYFLVNNVANE